MSGGELVERVAAALRNNKASLSNPEAEALARAAIAAMREPTEAMVAAAGSDWGPALEDNWHKMIDEALK